MTNEIPLSEMEEAMRQSEIYTEGEDFARVSFRENTNTVTALYVNASETPNWDPDVDPNEYLDEIIGMGYTGIDFSFDDEAGKLISIDINIDPQAEGKNIEARLIDLMEATAKSGGFLEVDAFISGYEDALRAKGYKISTKSDDGYPSTYVRKTLRTLKIVE